MVEKLESKRVDVALGMIDRKQEKVALQDILSWYRRIKEAREELTYREKRDFLKLLSVVVMVDKRKSLDDVDHHHIRVKLPEIQALIPQDTSNVDGHTLQIPSGSAQG